MAYITTEEVKNFRNEIKKAFPAQLGWKFSIRRRHCSTICIDILEAPIQLMKGERMEKGHTQVNVYHLKNSQYLNEFGIEVCEKILAIISNGWFDKSDSMTDYFHTAWYRDINIGTWDKQFKVSEKKMNEKYLSSAA